MIRNNITLILVLIATCSLGCRARFDAIGVQSTALEAGDGDAVSATFDSLVVCDCESEIEHDKLPRGCLECHWDRS